MANPIEPDYYNKTNMSVCDIVDTYDLNYNKGNVIKYVCRAGKKNPDKEIEDLQKAKKFIEIEIERLNRRANHE